MQRSRSEPNAFARGLFARLPTRYDALAELLSFGQNRRWRRRMVDAVLGSAGPSGRLLDVATGTAGVALLLTERSDLSVTGLDLSEPMLRRGEARVAERGHPGRISLVLARAEELPFADATFDALTFTYLLRYVADPAATLRELARVVRPGGAIASLEFGVPTHPLWWLGWVAYTSAVLPVAGLLTGGREWARVGRFLGPSIRAHYRSFPVEWTKRAWEQAGIEDVIVAPMSLGAGLVMSGRRSRG